MKQIPFIKRRETYFLCVITAIDLQALFRNVKNKQENMIFTMIWKEVCYMFEL